MTFSEGGSRQRFEDKFTKVCRKYPFFQHYLDTIESPRENYVIYVFHEPNTGSGGGLGDRLGGLITAFAFAMRTNRTFLVTGDAAFEEGFRPYHPTRSLSWANWDWAGWNKAAHWKNMTYNRHCVNPKPQNTQCALDSDLPFRVVKVKSNRSYLCRWLVKDNVVPLDHLYKTLGITASSDLFEVAGCMMRMAMWPSDKLWQAVDESLAQTFTHSGYSGETTAQIGFHFRCGDSSFSKESNDKVNPECVLGSQNLWKGTKFFDDHSYDSPVDEGVSVHKIVRAC